MIKLLVALMLSAVPLLAACGGDDDGGGASTGTCDAVCACVVAAGGDNAQCQNECVDSLAAGGNVKASCEAKLDVYQIPQCKPKCEGFPTGG